MLEHQLFSILNFDSVLAYNLFCSIGHVEMHLMPAKGSFIAYKCFSKFQVQIFLAC